ncbi:MAG TPA: Flp pilus assembly protein CpaB [Actinomycetota bacterium]|nr:Flp pilus assembly protein CpaB [Actinomycetota bacterium]
MRRSWWRRSRASLAASVVLAVLAGLLVRSHLARYAAVAASVRPDVPVVVAARAVRAGERLSRADLRLVLVPRAYAPPGALARVEQAAGRVALGDLAPGEAVTATRLARVRAGPVASLVPPGLRAFAVPSSLPRGAISAGDRVDVLATYGPPRARTETVATGVEVLAAVSGQAGARSSRGPLPALPATTDGPTVLLLLVTPEQQAALAYAKAFGALEVTVGPPEEPP